MATDGTTKTRNGSVFVGRPRLLVPLAATGFGMFFFSLFFIGFITFSGTDPTRLVFVGLQAVALVFVAVGVLALRTRTLLVNAEGVTSHGRLMSNFDLAWKRVSYVEVTRRYSRGPRVFSLIEDDGSVLAYMTPRVELGEMVGEGLERALSDSASQAGVALKHVSWQDSVFRRWRKGR